VSEAETTETTETEAEMSPDVQDPDVQEWLESQGVYDDDQELDQAEETVDEPALDAAPPETHAEEVQDGMDASPDTDARKTENPGISKSFARLTRKERELHKERSELQRLREELKPWREARDAADQGDMMGALKKVGFDYERATNQVLQNGTPQKQTTKQTPELEARLNKLESYEKQKQIDDYVGNLKSIVDSDPKYELVKAQWDAAWPTIIEMQKMIASESGTVKPEHEILQDVEDYYEDQARALTSSAKMKRLFGQTDDVQKSESTSDSQRTRQRRTLRNRVSAAPAAPSPDSVQMTARQKVQWALSAAEAEMRGT
jgi:hypothetical protein